MDIKVGQIYKCTITNTIYTINSIVKNIIEYTAESSYGKNNYSEPIQDIEKTISQGLVVLVDDSVSQLDSGCSHEWTELTLFTSVITYCPKCNKERK